MADDTEVHDSRLTDDKPDNVIRRFARVRGCTEDSDGALDDDELIRRANEKIAAWKAAGTPSLTEVQELFQEFDLRRCQLRWPATRSLTPSSPPSAPSLAASAH